MAITAAERNQIIELTVLMFNAAPGATYLSQIVALYEANSGTQAQKLQALANQLASTSAYTSLHPNFETAEEFAADFLTPLGLQNDATAKDFVIAKFNAGVSKGQIAYEAYAALNAVPSTGAAQYVTANAILNNKTTVAEYYSVTKEVATTALSSLQAVLVGVDATASSVTSAEARIDSGTGSAVGNTFTLTTGVDVLTGTASSDVFYAADTTLTAADQINGGDGADTLNFTYSGAGAAFPAASITNVETLNIRNVGTGAVTLDVSTVAGLTAVNADRATNAVTLTNVATGSSVGMVGDGTAANGNLSFAYTSATAPLTINVMNGTTQGTIANTGASRATNTVNSTGAANTITSLDLGTGTNVTALTVNAASNLTATLDATDFAGTAALTVAGAATSVNLGSNGNFRTIDASGLTAGGLTIALGTNTTSFKGGAGNDIVTAAAVATTTASTVDAGAGTDRLVIAASADVDTAAEAKVYSGFEVLQTAAQTVDVSLFTNSTITGIRVGGAATFNNLSAAQAQNVTFTAGGAATLAVTGATNGGQIDTVKANLLNSSGSGAQVAIDLTGITLAGVEKLELTSNGTTSTNAGAVTLTTTNATVLDSIKLTSAGVNTITIAAGHQASNLNVDASASSGGTTINASAYNTTTGALLASGSGQDVLLGSVKADTLTAGAGNDVLSGDGAVTIGTAATSTTIAALTAVATGHGAADVLTGGAGRDVFAFAPGVGNALTVASSITDLDLGGSTAATGVDNITFDGTAGAATIVTLSDAQQTSVTAAGTLAAAVDAVLAIASGLNNVAKFTYGADTYLVINGAAANAAYTAAEDLVVKITGVAGTLDASDITII